MKRYLGADLHRTQFTVCTRLVRKNVSAAVADAGSEAVVDTDPKTVSTPVGKLIRPIVQSIPLEESIGVCSTRYACRNSFPHRAPSGTKRFNERSSAV